MWWETVRKLPVPVLCTLAGFAAGAFAIAMLDSDRSYKAGPVEIGASQNSPISKCKARQNGVEAKLSSEDAELSRIATLRSQKQKVVDDMRDLYLKQGIAQVSNAQEQADYDARHSDISVPLVSRHPREQSDELRLGQGGAERPARIISSYMLTDNINELRTIQGDYSRQQAAKTQTLLQLEQLGQECFGIGKKL